MVTENVDIRFRETGARVIKRKVDQIGVAANNATRGIFLLQRALFVLGGAGILRALTRQFDTLTAYENRLRLTAKSAENLSDVQDELFKAANRSRTSFESVAEVYTRAALSTRQLGTSQRELIDFTESLSKATIISGASAREANAALIQLGQGLASNTLRGDELRAVLEQLPFVADIIARGLTKTGKFGEVSRGDLRKLAEDGVISAEIILDAFKDAKEEIDELFANTQVTIGQAFTIMKNQVLQFIDSFDDATGASELLARAIIKIGSNIDLIVASVLALTAALAGNFTAKLINRATEYFLVLKGGAVRLSRMREISELLAASTVKRSAAMQANQALAVRELQLNASALAASKARTIQTIKETEFMVRGNRVRNLATGRFVSLTAAKAALTRETQRLAILESLEAKNAARLAQARAGVATATNATSAATARLAGAQAASNTLAARFTRTFPLLAGVINVVNVALTRMWFLLLANPITAIITAITTLTAAFVVWGNEIKVTEDGVVGLKDATIAAFQLMAESVEPVTDAIGEGFSTAVKSVNTALGGLLGVVGEVFIGMLKIIKNTLNQAIGFVVGTVAGIKASWQTLPAAAADVAIRVANFFIENFEKFVNVGIRGINKIIEAFNFLANRGGKIAEFFGVTETDLIKEFDEKGIPNAFAGAGANAGAAFGKAYADAQRDFLGVALDFALEQASNASDAIIERARANIAAAAKKSTVTEGERSGNGLGDGDDKKKGKDKNALTFEEALAAIERETAALQLNNREREIANGLQEIERDIKRGLTQGELELADAALRRLQVSQDQADLLEEIRGPQQQLQIDQAALNELYKQGRIELEEYLEKLRELKGQALEISDTFSGGFKNSINQAIMTTKEFGEAVGGVVVGAVNKAADAIVEFARTGQINIRALVSSVIADLLRLAAQQLLLNLLGSLVGAPNAAGGGGFGGAIRSIFGFDRGGSILPSGSGTSDSQVVTFAKRPDERVDVLTPEQQRQRDNGGSSNNASTSNDPAPVNLKVANILDPSIVGDFMQTGEGERIIVNVIRRSGILEG